MEPQEIDKLAYASAFGSNSDKKDARFRLWNLALERGVVPSSINALYFARGRGEVPTNFTVPAMNLRGMAYDAARAVFMTAKKHNVGALICELARSEMGYTAQPPSEYASVVIAGALKEGWRGPLFIQCDHFQAKPDTPGIPKKGEIETIKALIREAINAGFYNVDIDMSTLVDYEKPTEVEQQKGNIEYSLELAKFVRALEPAGVTISLGGEVGHIGGKNSTMEEVGAFLDGFNTGLPKDLVGISKISIQTGTSHGGTVLADGTLAAVDVDLDTLRNISRGVREKYRLGGAVQHGASTLSEEYFGEFPKSETLEIHLATGFQNIQMDHEAFPKELLRKIYGWIDETKQGEKKEDWTNEQFHYKLRKEGWGQFKKETWEMDEDRKAKIRNSLANRFEFMFKKLNVVDTKDMVNKIIKPVKIEKSIDDFEVVQGAQKEVKGLAD